MKPMQDRATMATRDVAAGLANGHRVLTVLLQPLAFFLQEDGGQHGRRPETQERRGTHQLSVVQTQCFFALAEKHLDVQRAAICSSKVAGIGLQIAAGPITACEVHERIVQC